MSRVSDLDVLRFGMVMIFFPLGPFMAPYKPTKKEKEIKEGRNPLFGVVYFWGKVALPRPERANSSQVVKL